MMMMTTRTLLLQIKFYSVCSFFFCKDKEQQNLYLHYPSFLESPPHSAQFLNSSSKPHYQIGSSYTILLLHHSLLTAPETPYFKFLSSFFYLLPSSPLALPTLAAATLTLEKNSKTSNSELSAHTNRRMDTCQISSSVLYKIHFQTSLPLIICTAPESFTHTFTACTAT
mmetsp:Transcript_14768/g.18224  ORF Transcript_14768/g.18224 Transcript_14768/m.18224 type:complete len:169 (+) Transcript_14768:2712-3218(+)